MAQNLWRLEVTALEGKNLSPPVSYCEWIGCGGELQGPAICPEMEAGWL